jgi:hypothetical protein
MSPLSDYEIIGPVTYRGKKNCDSAICTRQWLDGEMSEDCMGWHCVYCDAPCSYQGHSCGASDAILGEASRQAARARNGRSEDAA